MSASLNLLLNHDVTVHTQICFVYWYKNLFIDNVMNWIPVFEVKLINNFWAKDSSFSFLSISKRWVLWVCWWLLVSTVFGDGHQKQPNLKGLINVYSLKTAEYWGKCWQRDEHHPYMSQTRLCKSLKQYQPKCHMPQANMYGKLQSSIKYSLPRFPSF